MISPSRFGTRPRSSVTTKNKIPCIPFNTKDKIAGYVRWWPMLFHHPKAGCTKEAVIASTEWPYQALARQRHHNCIGLFARHAHILTRNYQLVVMVINVDAPTTTRDGAITPHAWGKIGQSSDLGVSIS
jgi:hypothetical protein